MRWVALVAATAVAAVVVFVVAIVAAHDSVPDDLKTCLQDGGARIVRGPDGLGIARRDIEVGRLRDGRRTRVGDDEAVLLGGAGYAVLVLRTPDNPPFGRDVGADAYLRTGEFAIVALEAAGVSGVLAGCVDLVASR